MLVIGSAVCSDGWGSSSIGRRGACSGHGGVRHWPGIIAFIFSAFVALRFHEYLANRNEKPGSPDRIEAQGPSNSLGHFRATSTENSATESTRTRRRTRTYIQCPRCRSKMALRTATRGEMLEDNSGDAVSTLAAKEPENMSKRINYSYLPSL